MRQQLLPHRAQYAITRPNGTTAGVEAIVVVRSGAGWRIESELEATWPEQITATIDWELDQALLTRLLRINSRERYTGAHELELTITGNGLLAHRVAPDGPTQVELGWGPHAELDHISAAFATVMMERMDVAPGETREVDAVQLGTADLVPTIIPVVVRGLEYAGPVDGRDGQATTEAARVEWTVTQTGGASVISTTYAGALSSYGRLLRLTSLEASK